MRKFFSFFAALLFAGSMMAQVTITPKNSSWTSTAGAQTGTVEGVTVAVTNGVTGSTTAEGATMRIYKDATLTISSASNISKIVFNCVANNTTKYGPGCFGAQEGYSYDAKVGTWEGSATSVSFTASSAQVRVTSIVVTLAEGGETPVEPGDEPVAEWAEITFTKATAAGVFNDTVFTVEGSEFSLKCVDTDGKLKTTANNASFGTVEDRHDYAFRLQTGGKSSSNNNMELNIPADGQLRFAVRTATASDETRTVVLVQGTDTIYNKVAVDKDTVKGASNPRIYNFAYVNVKAGKVAVSYPVNGVNFYSFAFKADVVPPTPEKTYTVVGGSAPLFGNTWDPAYEANNMEPITGSKYLYAWEKDSVALTAGDIEFKVCEDHAWTKAWPAQNYKLNIAEAGLYKVSIFFNPEFGDSAVYAMAEKKGEAKVLPNIILHGNFTGSWADTEAFTPASDSLTASLTLALAEGTYEFGFKFDGAWKANGANLTREANTANLSTGEGNMHIAADVPGNYVFTYTYETQGVVVTYPEPIIVPDTVKIVVKEDLEWTDAVAKAGWWQIVGENEGYSFSLSNSYTTEVPGIYTVEDLDETYSYVKPINGTDKIHFVSGQVVVAINTDSIITFVGALTGTDNKVYAFDLAYDPAAVNPYKYDEKDADFIYNFDSYKINTQSAAQGIVGITTNTDSTYISMTIILPQGQTTLVAGEYPVAATPAYQTVYAGYYDNDKKSPAGSMAATLIEQGGKLYYNEIWYLVSGKATVDADLNITVDALNSNSKLIKANLKAQAQGIEDVKAAQKATKSLKNGILVIEKNGVQYNVTGQEIR